MAKIKLRRDTYTNWFNANPVLALGEPAYDTSNNKLKIGDGTSDWRTISYLTDVQGTDGSYTPTTLENWLGSPTVGTVVEGLDELASRVTTVEGTSVSTGDITFSGVKIIGAGTASGDGAGYSTLELVPDNNLYANDQYLVVDPTAPSHIHIRAGGAQDASNAELYLGGEKNYVRVTDFNGVRLYNETSFDNTEYYLDGAQFTLASWTAGAEGQPSTVTFTSTDQSFIDILFNIFNDDRNTLQVVTPEGTFTLTPTGFGSIGSDVWRFNVNEIPEPTPQIVSEIILTIWTTRQNSLSLSNNDFTVEVTDDIRITGSDTFSLRNESTTDPITIRTDYNRANHAWEFEADGNLRLPESGEMIFSSGGPAGRIIPSVSDGIGLQIQAELDFEIKVNDGQGGSNIWSFAGSDITFPDATVQTTAYTGLLSTVAKTGGTASVGAATAITVTNSPNPNWTSGTGVSANGINFVIAVDGSGNATVTTINDGGTGHFVGETFGPLPGSALGGTDEVDDVYFEVTAIDLTTTTALDLTKSVNKLTDGYYTLADGVEGQLMYLVRQNGAVAANIFVTVSNARLDNSESGTIVYDNIEFYPFNTSGSFNTMTTLIFTDGAWQSNNGSWD